MSLNVPGAYLAMERYNSSPTAIRVAFFERNMAAFLAKHDKTDAS